MQQHELHRMRCVVEKLGGSHAKFFRPDRFSSQPVGLRKAGAQHFKASVWRGRQKSANGYGKLSHRWLA